MSAELHAMWRWLAGGGFDAEVAATRELHPQVMSMRTWLETKHPAGPAQ